MTQYGDSDPNGLAAAVPPGEAPLFGFVPDAPFEAVPERLVLSSEAHSRLADHRSLARLNGDFALAAVGTGRLHVSETLPGEVHVRADVLTLDGPSVSLEANVRESWLERAVGDQPGGAAVVQELFRLAEIPGQRTVTVRVDSASS